MAKRRFGSNRGQNLGRATAIIQGMQEEASEVDTPAPEGQQQDVETPTPEVEVETDVEVPTPTPEAQEPTPQVDVEVNTEDTTPVIDEPPVDVNTEPELTDELIFSKLSETLGRTIESFDDLKPKEIQLDEEVKELIEWKEKTGLSLSKWNEFNKDYSSMSDLDIARETLRLDYPTLSKEELEYSLKDFIFDEDYDDDSEKIAKSIKLKKLAQEGRQKLEDNKVNLPKSTSSLTQEQQKLIEYANQTKAEFDKMNNAREVNSQGLVEAAKNLSTLKLDLAEGVSIDYKIDDQDKKGLETSLLTMPTWYNEDGSQKHDVMAIDGYKIKNFDSLLKVAFEQGKSVGLEESIKSKGNLNLDGTESPQGIGEENKGNIDQIVSHLTGKKKGSSFRFRKK